MVLSKLSEKVKQPQFVSFFEGIRNPRCKDNDFHSFTQVVRCRVSSRACPVAEVIEAHSRPAFPNEMANGGSVRILTMAAAISSVVSATSTCVPA